MTKLELLKCVKCKNETIEIRHKTTTLVCSACGHNYKIEKDVPIMVIPDDESEIFQSGIHKKQGTEFKYKEHYHQDALDFDYFQVRDSGTEHSERRVREYIFSHTPKSPKRILDVGCGKAWVAEMFCSTSGEVISMDIANTNVVKALEKYPFENHSGVVADVLNLPFRENLFDCIIASEIIEHVVHPDKFIKNLIEVLKPGGTLILTTPYKEKLQYSLCIHCNKLTPQHAHIHSFDETILADLYPNKNNVDFSYKTFGNKVLMHLRTHFLLRHFPFNMWLMFDRIANMVYKAPATIMVKWTKLGNTTKSDL